MRTAGMSLEAVFNRYDVSQTGKLTVAEVLSMANEMVPDATKADIMHMKVRRHARSNDSDSLLVLHLICSRGSISVAALCFVASIFDFLF